MTTNDGRKFKYEDGVEYFVAFNEDETQVKCDGNIDENELYHLIMTLQKALNARLSPALISSCIKSVSNLNEALALYIEEENNNSFCFYLIIKDFNKDIGKKINELENKLIRDNPKLDFEFSVRETQGKVSIESLANGELIWKRS